MTNLLTLGQVQKAQNIIVAPAEIAAPAADAAEMNANRKMYEMALDAFAAQTKKGEKIKDNAILNNYELTNYTYKMGNDRLYIVDKNDSKFIYGSLAMGNIKLKATDKEMYIQFNTAQKVTCPVMGITCNSCYADNSFMVKLLKSNGEISNTGISRIKNTILTQFKNFEQIFNGAIDYLYKQTNKKIVVRFHESGDFYSRKYWQKAKNIMVGNTKASFMIYTRVPHIMREIPTMNKHNNIMMRFSVDTSTPEKTLQYVIKHNVHTFIAINKKDNNYMEILNQFYDLGIICNIVKVDNVFKMATSKELSCLECGKCRNKSIIHKYVVIH